MISRLVLGVRLEKLCVKCGLRAKTAYHRARFASSRAHPTDTGPDVSNDSPLFNYTSGRWIYNNALRHVERRRVFDVPEFKRLAAKSINRNSEDVSYFCKLSEGGFNRTFLIRMCDGVEVVGRVLYLLTEPRHLLVASEVATIDFLRLHGIPVPEIYDYSTSCDNPAGTEYIFMERMRGTNLGDVWFDLAGESIATFITNLVRLESRLFAIDFSASGSLYYDRDLPLTHERVKCPTDTSLHDGSFCIGPETSLGLWYGNRQKLRVNRGPYNNPIQSLTAGAKKEMTYLTEYGQPLHPFQRLYRETFKYQKQSHEVHLESLQKYLTIAPYLVPVQNQDLSRPTLRHPDLQPGNIFVSQDLEITGLIDWQHSPILPRFLQAGIPNSVQNYGDAISESLETPELPQDFANMSEDDKAEQLELLRRRQLHFTYVTQTTEMNPDHHAALAYNHSILRRKLYHHASDPWEGNSTTLRADLIQLTNHWPETTCPITFTKDEKSESKKTMLALAEADEQLKMCRDVIGMGPEGWVPIERYDETKRVERQLREDALESAETSEEWSQIYKHWPFDDFDEKDYL